MINIANYIAGNAIRILALITLRLFPSFKKQFTRIENKIETINRRNFRLPQHLILSIIEIEDKRYFHHLGIDFYSILRALLKNITTNRFEGASTIVQQLVRVITDEREISIRRKVKEIMLAVLINNEFTKNEIISAYLNTYRFHYCYGIFAFCKAEKYDIDNLSFNECAQIAARLKYPSINKSNYIKYLKRVRTIERKTMPTASNRKNGGEEITQVLFFAPTFISIKAEVFRRL